MKQQTLQQTTSNQNQQQQGRKKAIFFLFELKKCQIFGVTRQFSVNKLQTCNVTTITPSLS